MAYKGVVDDHIIVQEALAFTMPVNINRSI